MATLLDSGDFTFLSAKIAIGAITALVLLRWGNRTLARYGLTLALAVYLGLMGIHVITGLSAFGLLPQAALQEIAPVADVLLAMVM